MINLKESTIVQEYYSNTISELIRLDLGIKGFNELDSELAQLKKMIDEMLSIAIQYKEIPSGLIDQLLNIIGQFNSYANSLKNYNIDQDGNNNFQIRKQIITSINNWYRYIFQTSDDNRQPVNFLQIYNSFKTYSLINLQNENSEIERIKSETLETNRKANEIVKLLQSKSSSESVQDYSNIFSEESKMHSNIKISLNPFHIKLGNAQIWLIASIILIGLFTLLALNLNDYFPIDLKSASSSTITLELITRLLFISFNIYIIAFSLKQYNVQKHLYVLNKHRMNTLNSYRLFIESLDKDDITTKNALMMEVAKAIYETGNSGYISSKDSPDNPSIIELTRFIGQKQ